MKFNLPPWAYSPHVRVGAGVAVLVLFGWIAIHFGLTTTGICVLIAALAAAGGYLMLVVRPARLPHDGLLRLRLEGAIREHAYHNPIERLTGRSFPSLEHIRRALMGAARDPHLGAVMVEISGLETGFATAQELH